MTIVFGRKQLIIRVTSEEADPVADRYPMAYAASDRELARLSQQGGSATERLGHEVHRVLNGAGWVR